MSAKDFFRVDADELAAQLIRTADLQQRIAVAAKMGVKDNVYCIYEILTGKSYSVIETEGEWGTKAVVKVKFIIDDKRYTSAKDVAVEYSISPTHVARRAVSTDVKWKDWVQLDWRS